MHAVSVNPYKTTNGLLKASLYTCAIAVAACSGSSGDSGGTGGAGNSTKGGNGGSQQAEIVLDRNPNRKLVCDDPNQVEIGNTPLVRLTNAEYARTISDLLAPIKIDIQAKLSGNNLRTGFAPDEALVATNDVVGGHNTASIDVGKAVSAGLATLKIDGCPPANAAAEGKCFDAFLDSFVTRAYRRPLDADERARLKGLYDAQRKVDDFNTTIATVAEAVVQGPQFLYRVEIGDEERDGIRKLSGHEVASRLSFLIWGSMPDEELFKAATDGGLDDGEGVASQVSRMLADERANGLARDYIELSMHLETRRPRAELSQKNTKVFAKYTAGAVAGLNAGFDRFVEHALLGEEGGIRKLLSSTDVWVNDDTAFIYGVNAPGSKDLQRVAADGAQRAGILTQGLLLTTGANAEKQAPVQRAMVVLDHFLCQPPPPPPGGMIPPPPPPEPVARTTRQRLELEHEAQSAVCMSCHTVIDQFGFAFEHYNAIGAWQDEEDGKPIDASVSIADTYDTDGDYTDAVPFIEKLAQSEQVAQCHVESFFRFASGRAAAETDGCTVAKLTDRVVHSKDDFRALVETFTSSDVFRFRSALVQ
jgi:Protein of unknown function (DUF1592)/Protein of unknown function (DUF1588)/Protein of unknown function (DUF1595)/Protein of unknown function (DUF1585)